MDKSEIKLRRERALKHYDLWLEAETAVATSHDSDTLQGFLDNADEHLLELIRTYFGIGEDEKDENIRETIARNLMASVSDVCMFEIQDLFGLGNEARINCPGIVGGNWDWRAVESDFDKKIAEKYEKMAKTYGRI